MFAQGLLKKKLASYYNFNYALFVFLQGISWRSNSNHLLISE